MCVVEVFFSVQTLCTNQGKLAISGKFVGQNLAHECLLGFPTQVPNPLVRVLDIL